MFGFLELLPDSAFLRRDFSFFVLFFLEFGGTRGGAS